MEHDARGMDTIHPELTGANSPSDGVVYLLTCTAAHVPLVLAQQSASCWPEDYAQPSALHHAAAETMHLQTACTA